MPNKIAVIGDKDSVLAFGTGGVEVFDAVTAEQADKLVKRLTNEQYAVIMITEPLAEKIPETIRRAKAQAYPILLPIPTSTGSTGFGMEGIKRDVEKAIGTDILFNKEEK